MKQIEIRDYQGIDSASIELADGVTVLAGASDSGKSSVVRAIRDFAYNSIGDGHVQAGKDHAAVLVDGVHWEKGKKVNRYTMPDGTVYDKVGRGQVPADVQAITGIREVVYGDGVSARLNVQSQFDPEFGVGFKGSDNAKIVGSISRLEQVFNGIRDATAEHGKARKQEEAAKTKLEADQAVAESLAWVDNAVALHERARVLGTEVLTAQVKVDGLKTLAGKATASREALARSDAEDGRLRRALSGIDARSDVIRATAGKLAVLRLTACRVAQARRSATETETESATVGARGLKDCTTGRIEGLGSRLVTSRRLWSRLASARIALAEIAGLGKGIQGLKAADSMAGEIGGLGERLGTLRRLKQQFEGQTCVIRATEGNLRQVKAEMTDCERKLAKALDGVKICPLTNGPRLCQAS